MSHPGTGGPGANRGSADGPAEGSADAAGDPLAGLDLGAAAARPGAWLELAVTADHEAVEAVSEILARVAPGGTSVEPAFELVDEGLAARVDLSRPTTIRAHLPVRDPAAIRDLVRAAERDLGHLQAFGLRPIGDLAARIVHESDWADAWKRHFPVLRIGRRLVIRPTWRRHRRAPDDVILAMDPGMAFGTGLHPTTRLCLGALEGLADRGVLSRGGPDGGPSRVLDVGSGSGILAIAAAKLGAGAVRAVDVDPIAVEATAANARRNGLARRISAGEGSVPTGAGPVDVVLANLIASLLVTLAPALAGELRAGGILLASGIFIDREAEVAGALAGANLVVTDRREEGDWVALEAVRGPG
jgi:ribosomal protein L11 methyltransferase